MSSQTNTLTEGPLAKQIFLVSLPLALSNLLVARFYGARQDVYKRQLHDRRCAQLVRLGAVRGVHPAVGAHCRCVCQ